jgi:hypothetical protein
MAMSDPHSDPDTDRHTDRHSDRHVLAAAVRRELLRIAVREDDLAAAVAASVPYWAPHPPSVQAHRTAAAVLRSEADQLLTAS